MCRSIVYLILAVLELLNYAFKNSAYSAIILFIQIAFILLLHLKSINLGLRGILASILLGYGKWVYLGTDITIYSLLNYKVLGISTVFWLCILHLAFRKERLRINYSIAIPLMAVMFYSLFLLVIGVVYLDNFIDDLKTIMFFLLFLIVTNYLSKQEIREIVVYSIDVSILMLVVSSLLVFRFEYGKGHEYLPINSLTFFVPVFLCLPLISVSGIGFIRKLFWFVPCACIIVFDNFFISGKFLILLIFGFLIVFKYGAKKWLLFISILAVAFVVPFLNLEDPIANYKMEQVRSLFKTSSYNMVISNHTTVGNVLSELDNIFKQPNKFFLFFGKGLGGGITDENGYLRQFAGTGGYSKLDGLRNDYFKMHLPISEILVKFGLVGFITFFSIVWNIFRMNTTSVENIIMVLCLLTVFYISKEYLLLTALLIVSQRSEKASENLVSK